MEQQASSQSSGRGPTFDAALKDAVDNLPEHKPAHPDELCLVKVTETGAEYGGIDGRRDVVLKIEARYQ
jgi:hypothetical protein